MFSRFFRSYRADSKDLSLTNKLFLGLAFSLPLERIPSLEVGGFTIKLSLIFAVLVLISLIRDLLNGGVRKNLLASLKLSENWGWLISVPVGILSYSVLTILWAENLSYWLRANINLGFAVLLFYEAIAVLSLSPNKKQALKLLSLIFRTILLVTTLVLGFGFFQWFGDLLNLSPSVTGIRPEYSTEKLGLPRMHSTFLEPLYFGLYLLLPLGLSLSDRKSILFGKYVYNLAFVGLIYIAILLSLARGAIVASALMGIVAFFWNYKDIKQRVNRKVLLKATLAGLAVILLLGGIVTALGKKGNDADHNYSKGIGTILGHLETIKPWGNKEDAKDQNSINSRDVARSEAWGVINQNGANFFVGVGAGQYGLSLNPKQDFGATSNFMFLDVWSEYGFMMVTFVGLFLLMLTGLSLKLSKGLIFGLGLYLLGFLIQGISFGELTIAHLWVVAGIVVFCIKLKLLKEI